MFALLHHFHRHDPVLMSGLWSALVNIPGEPFQALLDTWNLIAYCGCDKYVIDDYISRIFPSLKAWIDQGYIHSITRQRREAIRQLLMDYIINTKHKMEEITMGALDVLASLTR